MYFYKEIQIFKTESTVETQSILTVEYVLCTYICGEQTFCRHQPGLNVLIKFTLID